MSPPSRNYFENDFHFSRPQIDWAGEQSGFVGTAFPLLPFLAALLYTVFGVYEWIGHTLTILFFAVSLPFMFALVRRASGELARSPGPDLLLFRAAHDHDKSRIHPRHGFPHLRSCRPTLFLARA